MTYSARLLSQDPIETKKGPAMILTFLVQIEKGQNEVLWKFWAPKAWVPVQLPSEGILEVGYTTDRFQNPQVKLVKYTSKT